MSQFSRALQTIELTSNGDDLLVVLPEGEEQPNQKSFPFPPLPWSTMNWLGALGGSVWNQHEMCCALLLLINPDRRCWGCTLPPQTPRKDGVRWQMSDAVAMGNTPDTPRHIGGTYQMAQVQHPDEALSLVPEIDGLHIIHPTGMEPAGAYPSNRLGRNSTA